MSARDLAISVSFDADVNELAQIDAQTDDVAANLANTGDVGETAMGDVGDAAQGASDDIGDADKTSQGFFKTLEDNWKQITLVAGAAGAGLEAFARKQGDTNELLDKTATATGQASGELRDMAVAMSDSHLSAEDNIAAFDELQKRGFDTKEEFEDIVPAANDLATATGQDVTDAIYSAERALSPFGEGLDDIHENTDQLTRIMQETDIPLGSFERNLGRVPDELQALEFGLDDAAAGVEVFRDRGFEGKEAVREFRRAVDESDGDMDAFLDTIGLTADEWKDYQEQVEPAADLTQDMADASDENATFLEKLQTNVSNLMTEYGEFAELAGLIAPALMAVGPAIGLFSKLLPLFKLAGVALGALASPVGLIVAGVVAIGAGFVLAYNKVEWFRDGVNAAWEWLKETTAVIFEAVMEIVGVVWDFIVESAMHFWERLMAIWDEHGEFIIERATMTFELISDIIQNAMQYIQGIFEIVWPIISNVIKVAWELIKTIVTTGIDIVTGLIDAGMSLLQGDWQGAWDAIKGIASDIWHNIEDFFRNIDLFQIGKDIINGLVDGISSMAGAVWDSVKSIGSSIKDGFTDFFSIASPSKLMQEMGQFVGEGMQVGMDDSAMKVAKSAQSLAEKGNPGEYQQKQPVSRGSSGKNINVGDIKVVLEGVSDEKQAKKAGRAAGQEFKKEVYSLIESYNKRQTVREV